MPAISIRDPSEASRLAVCADRGFFAKPETYDQIYAYGREMGWMEKPFHFVVSRWLDRANAVAASHGKDIEASEGAELTFH